MTRYRNSLPQISSAPFITDGGLETTLVYHEGIELPSFAAFVTLDTENGLEALDRYFRRYVGIARERGVGAILATPTWRASEAWGRQLGYPAGALADINRRAVKLLTHLRDSQPSTQPLVITGLVGPRADGYRPTGLMRADEAQCYHSTQIRTFADSEADMVSAETLNYVEEAIGIARAADTAGVPVTISFTVETDGRLPTGQPLGDAIQAVDQATGSSPIYYMVNCAHPSHFADALTAGAPWIERLRGMRVNASRKSHAELNVATELDAGNPVELARELSAIRSALPHLNIFGGCCGTDHRHLDEMARTFAPLSSRTKRAS